MVKTRGSGRKCSAQFLAHIKSPVSGTQLAGHTSWCFMEAEG